MIELATDADKVGLWVEHGARYAAHVGEVSSQVREARAAALDELRDMPTLGNVARQGDWLGRPETNALFGGVGSAPGIWASSGEDPMARVARSLAESRKKRKYLRDMRAGAMRQIEEADRRKRLLELERDRQRAEDERARQRKEAERQQALEREREKDQARAAAEEAERAAAAEEERKKRQQEAEAARKARVEQRKAAEARQEASKLATEKQATIPDKTEESLPAHLTEALQAWKRASLDTDTFLAMPEMKKPGRELRKRVNRACNQIAVSVKAVKTTLGALTFAQQEADSCGVPSASLYCQKHIAERLVAESRGSVALSQPSAFAAAAVIASFVGQARDSKTLHDIFLSAFYEECPYTAPQYIRRIPNESTESFRARLKYLPDETADAYVERMCGYVRLFAAILQTDTLYHNLQHGTAAAKNPFSPELGWSWLARIANQEQRSITPDIVHTFLSVAGFRLAKVYGNHFAALLNSVHEACVRRAAKSARPGAVSRLDMYISEFFRSNNVLQPPEGRDLPAADAENQG